MSLPLMAATGRGARPGFDIPIEQLVGRIIAYGTPDLQWVGDRIANQLTAAQAHRARTCPEQVDMNCDWRTGRTVARRKTKSTIWNALTHPAELLDVLDADLAAGRQPIFECLQQEVLYTPKADGGLGSDLPAIEDAIEAMARTFTIGRARIVLPCREVSELFPQLGNTAARLEAHARLFAAVRRGNPDAVLGWHGRPAEPPSVGTFGDTDGPKVWLLQWDVTKPTGAPFEDDLRDKVNGQHVRHTFANVAEWIDYWAPDRIAKLPGLLGVVAFEHSIGWAWPWYAPDYLPMPLPLAKRRGLDHLASEYCLCDVSGGARRE